MALAAMALDLDQALDVLRHLPPQVALRGVVVHLRWLVERAAVLAGIQGIPEMQPAKPAASLCLLLDTACSLSTGQKFWTAHRLAQLGELLLCQLPGALVLNALPRHRGFQHGMQAGSTRGSLA